MKDSTRATIARLRYAVAALRLENAQLVDRIDRLKEEMSAGSADRNLHGLRDKVLEFAKAAHDAELQKADVLAWWERTNQWRLEANRAIERFNRARRTS